MRVKYISSHKNKGLSKAVACLSLSQVSLASERDVVAARLVKGRLERTTLGQVAADLSIAFKPGAFSLLLLVYVCMCSLYNKCTKVTGGRGLL
jgi:hypothetical protein